VLCTPSAMPPRRMSQCVCRTRNNAVDAPYAVVVVNELRSESVHARFLELFGPHFAVRKVPRAKMDAVHQHPAIDIFLLKLRRQRPDASPPAAAAEAAEREVQAAHDVPAASHEAANGSAACDGSEAAVHQAVTQPDAQHGIAGQGVAAPAAARDTNDGRPDAAQVDSPATHAVQPPGCVTAEDSPMATAGPQERQAEQGSDPCRDRVHVGSATNWQTRRQGAEAARLLASVHLPLD